MNDGRELVIVLTKGGDNWTKEQIDEVIGSVSRFASTSVDIRVSQPHTLYERKTGVRFAESG